MKKQLVAILGGKESGVGAALLAQQKGYDVFVSDFGSIPTKYKTELEKYKISFEEKRHSFDIIENAKWVVKSPGIPEKAGVIQDLRSKACTIISEIEFAYLHKPESKVIAVTGSNGKTTTTSLIFHMMQANKMNVVLGGNIGKSFSRVISEQADFDYAVLELSSFQLDDIDTFKADIAILLNITPDHLDRYDYNIEKYADSKWKITNHQSQEDVTILNQDDEWTNVKISRLGLSSQVLRLSAKNPMSGLASTEANHNLKGKHNDFNVAVAITVMQQIGLKQEQIVFGLRSFQAIEHRLESVAIINGVTYINDSKATNVDAVYYALDAIENNIIWIAGGVDKGNDYSVLKPMAQEKVKALICLGVDNSKLESAFEDVLKNIVSTDQLFVAIQEAFKIAERGDTVLLSPACASFDLFDNYENRGELFKENVLKLID